MATPDPDNFLQALKLECEDFEKKLTTRSPEKVKERLRLKLRNRRPTLAPFRFPTVGATPNTTDFRPPRT